MQVSPKLKLAKTSRFLKIKKNVGKSIGIGVGDIFHEYREQLRK